MVHVDFDQFDDELQRMQELMQEGEIALSESVLRVPVGSLNLKPAVTVSLGATLRECINIMAARHFGSILIVSDKKVVGIFTERDALMKVAGLEINLETPIDEFMTPEPNMIKTSDTVEKALRLTQGGGFRHVGVIDDKGEPVAVMSVRDIVSYIVEFFPQDILNLPPHPIRLGTRNRHGA